MDLNTQHESLNLTTSRFQQFSTTRVLAHELGHAVLGNRDVGFPLIINSRTVTPYPNVRFTDGIMRGINSSVRRTYSNYCKPSC